MRSNINLRTSRENSRVGLYSFVFLSRVSLSIVLFLLVSFFIQPIHLAMANEAAAEEQLEVPSVADDVATHEEVVEEPAVSDDVSINEEIIEAVVPDSNSPADNPDVEENAIPTDQEAETVEESVQDDVPSESLAETSTTTETEILPDEDIEDEIVATTTAPEGDSNDSTSTSTTPLPDTETSSTSTSTTSPESETNGSATSTDNNSSDDPSSETDNDSNDNPGSGAGDSDPSVSENASSTDETTASGEPDNNSSSDNSDSTSDSAENEVEILPTDSDATTTDEVSATSSESVDDAVTKVEYLVTDDNYYQFSKQACVSVGDGTYHCSISEGKIVDSQAVVYSEIGPSGSPEIFIKTSQGEIEQITDNNFEDSSPHYDPVSQKITWQRLIQGRYQIIIYNIETAEEKQLTFSRTNNMEPAVSVAGVVWQAWDNNDWEIMFYDGTYTDQLTDNAVQDVAPVMEDGYIIWTVIGNGEQFAQVYSFETKETVTISNHEGGSILNPRFVLVYDTQFDNGDVITQRFDPETGFAEAIAAKPAEAPLEIPEPDTTGEVKALITNKSASKQTLVVSDNNEEGTGTGTGTTSSSTSGTLNLIPSDNESTKEIIATSTDGTIEAATEDAPIEPFELTEYDLVILPTKAPSTTTEVNISNASSTQE